MSPTSYEQSIILPPKARRRRRPTAKRSDSRSLIWGVDSKSLFRGLPEVAIQQKIADWKAGRLSNPISKESTPEEASIVSYRDFESDRFAVGRLRRTPLTIVTPKTLYVPIYFHTQDVLALHMPPLLSVTFFF